MELQNHSKRSLHPVCMCYELHTANSISLGPFPIHFLCYMATQSLSCTQVTAQIVPATSILDKPLWYEKPCRSSHSETCPRTVLVRMQAERPQRQNIQRATVKDVMESLQCDVTRQDLQSVLCSGEDSEFTAIMFVWCATEEYQGQG